MLMEETLKHKFRDIEQKCRLISESAHDIHKAIEGLSKTGTFFGITSDNVIDLVREYRIRNGKMPMTSKSIQEAFRPDKIEIGAGWPPSIITRTKKAIRSEVFAANVQGKLYDLLPLHNVLTDYEGTIRRQGDTVRIMKPLPMFSLASRTFDLLIDRKVVVSGLQGIAIKLSHEIMSSNLYKWKAFAAHVFQLSEDRFAVIYGILEDKS